MSDTGSGRSTAVLGESSGRPARAGGDAAEATRPTAPGIDIDPHADPFATDPYPILNALRESTPVAWHPGMNAFWVTRDADVRTVVADEDQFLPELPPDPQPHRRMLTLMNGEEHRRYRALVTPAFAVRVINETFVPLLPGIASRLLDAFPGRGPVDLVERFANPLPAEVIRVLLQIEDFDERAFMRDADIALEHAADPTNATAAQEAPAATKRILAYIRQSVDADRARPRGGMISQLLSAQLDGERLGDDDVVNFCALLCIAGVETTQRLIANLMYALGTHPDQLDRARRDRDLLPTAVEETLRWAPPNQFRMRFARQDTELSGIRIPAGSLVYAFTGPANRDPRARARPDEFDVNRDLKSIRHVSFGWGRHLCIGAHLARQEAICAFGTLLDRFPEVRLAPGQDIGFAGFRNRSPRRLLVDLPRRVAT